MAKLIFENITTQTIPCFQTASSILSFIVAALLRPEVQTIAQKELDAVTRRERLPTFEDRPRLPFVSAICQEVIRWRPVTPIGGYHQALISLALMKDGPQVYLTQPK